MKLILNTNKELVEKIKNKLDENKEKYGERYCPCSIIKNEDTICPCKNFREQKELGECHCGLWIKTEL